MDILQIILPVVLIGAGALLVIYIAKNRSRKKSKEEDSTYIAEGMVIGMAIGTGLKKDSK